ncbi:MAG: dihydrofolate reductase family protein [Candidatus Bathyarchaeia archaeon]
MQKVLLYIAVSLDGFIAAENDDTSWLDAYQVEDEDYGYGVFIKNVDSAIMGSRTYQQALEHPERLLNDLKTYVLTSKPLPVKHGSNVSFMLDKLKKF